MSVPESCHHTPRVLLPLAEGFEELEAVTIIDVLRRADVEVVAAGLRDGPVRGSRGTVLLPDAPLDAVLGEAFDMLVLPGGMPGVRHLREDPRIGALVRRFHEEARYTAAICGAASVLAAQGLLVGRRVTSNPKFKDEVARPDVHYSEEAVVDDGALITSRGPGTAIAFALALVEKLVGRTRRAEVERGLVLMH
ncbi:MAG: DJ-1/PfpI family protein [Sinobacteraceae bacterium]|nr:DJ-1/PfpI family protein [Nevskiaceae bacterium]